MARFIGKVQGARGEASRLGHKHLITRAHSYEGGVNTELSIKNGEDWATVKLVPGSSFAGPSVVIYDGPLSAKHRELLAK